MGRYCLQEGPRDEDGERTTCTKPAGHEGPHKWERDDEARITEDYEDEDG